MSDRRDPLIRRAIVELGSATRQAPSWDEITAPHTEALAGPEPLVVPSRSLGFPGWAVASMAAAATLIAGGALVAFLLLPGARQPELFSTDGWEIASWSTEHGLPPGGMHGVAVGRDGVVWAAQHADEQLQLFRLDGGRWVRVGDSLATPYHLWMVSDGAGGVLMGVPPPGWSDSGESLYVRVARFDGERWSGFRGENLLPDMWGSTVKDGPDGSTWIIGYTHESGAYELSELVVAEVIGGRLDVHIQDDLPEGQPSPFSISDTVDVGPNGAVWIGNPSGAWRFHDGDFRFYPIESETDCCIGPIAVARDGAVWLLRDRDPLRLVGGTWTQMPRLQAHYESLPSPMVATPDGGIWVFSRESVRGEYLVHSFRGSDWLTYSPEEARSIGIPVKTSFTFVAFTSPDGAVVTCQSIASAPGDDRHCYRFAIEHWEQIPHGDLVPGPRSSADYTRGGTAVGPDGSIWRPTIDGVARFTPTQ